MTDNSAMDFASINPNASNQLMRMHTDEILEQTSQKNLLENHSEFGYVKEDAQKMFAEEPKIIENLEEEESATIKEITIDKLDENCLIKIFLYLPIEERLNMEEVCVRWQNVSKKAWHDVQKLKFDSKSDSNYLNPKIIEKLLARCGVYLKSLSFNYISSHMLMVIRKYCSNLTTISIKSPCADFEHASAFSKMEKIQSITLLETYSEFIVNCLLNLPKTVKSINLIATDYTAGFSSYVYDSLSDSTIGIIEDFNTLDSLKLQYYNINLHEIKSISVNKTLTKLSLAECKIEVGLNLIGNLTNLEYLDLRKVNTVDNQFMECLYEKLKKLKYLDVSFCKKLTNEGLVELENLNNLEVLLINNLTDSISDLPLGQLKKIKKLSCGYCKGVEDPGIMKLIKNCPDLEDLNLRGTSISDKTRQLALEVTKNRTNSVILSIYIQPSVFNEEIKDYSPFLNIYTLYGGNKAVRTLQFPSDFDDSDFRENDYSLYAIPYES